MQETKSNKYLNFYLILKLNKKLHRRQYLYYSLINAN